MGGIDGSPLLKTMQDGPGELSLSAGGAHYLSDGDRLGRAKHAAIAVQQQRLRRNQIGLCMLNFLSADIRDGLGPFAAVYLKKERKWEEHMIGIAMFANSVSQFCVQAPVGDFIDRTTRKKSVCMASCVVVALMSLAMVQFPGKAPVIVTRIVQGLGSAALPPAIAAITLGCVGPRKFARQISFNEVFNHAGMAVCSIAAGLASYFIHPSAIFSIVAATAVLSIACLPVITGIDHAMARGMTTADDETATASVTTAASTDEIGDTAEVVSPVGYLDVLKDRRILGFCLCCFGFHFGNAAMLPLLGQKLSLDSAADSSKLSMVFMTACQVIAQGTMTLVAPVVGKLADSKGRLPIFLLGFVTIPTRGFVVSTIPHHNVWRLIATQGFDGLANGIFGVLSVVVAEDLSSGSGRYHLRAISDILTGILT
jgi:MFS family permease